MSQPTPGTTLLLFTLYSLAADCCGQRLSPLQEDLTGKLELINYGAETA